MVAGYEAPLVPGMIVWVDLSPSVGKEQSGRRPVIVVSGDYHLELVTDLVTVMPITSVFRGWRNHVKVEPASLLPDESWVMTEQVRTISRLRIRKAVEPVGQECLDRVRYMLHIFTK
jgi:mRNA interferase MazF